MSGRRRACPRLPRRSKHSQTFGWHLFPAPLSWGAQRIELLERLDPDEKAAVIKIIDGLLTKKKFVDLVAQESAAAGR